MASTQLDYGKNAHRHGMRVGYHNVVTDCSPAENGILSKISLALRNSNRVKRVYAPCETVISGRAGTKWKMAFYHTKWGDGI